MTIVFTGGGTLGHIYPALSVIKYLKKEDPKIRIVYIANKTDQKYKALVENPDINQIYYFNTKGFSKKLIKNITTLWLVITEGKKIKEVLRKEQPQAVVGMGGYISGIVIREAIKLKYPTAIHEQNSVMGLANRLVKKKVQMVLTSFPMEGKNFHFVGNPRYDEAREYPVSLFRHPFNLLITSGSKGSQRINEVAIQFLNSEESHKYLTTLVTGEKYYDEVVQKVEKGHHYQILPFTNQMLELMARSSIMLSRSGATTIFESLGSKVIPIFVPSPNVTNNHQFHNALYVKSLEIGEIINEKDFSLETLVSTLRKIQNRYDHYQDKLNLYQPNPATILFARLIIKLGAEQ